MVVRWPGRMLCHRDRVVWWMLCHLWLLRVWRMLCRCSSTPKCFAAVVVLFDRCFTTVSCFVLLFLGIFGDRFLCRSCSSGGLCLGGLFGVSSPSVLLLLTTCCVSGYDRLCVCLYFFFSVSFFLVLCVLVLAKSCLAAASLCL